MTAARMPSSTALLRPPASLPLRFETCMYIPLFEWSQRPLVRFSVTL